MPDDLTHDRGVLGQGVVPVQLKSLVYHYSYLTLSKTWDKYNAYTDELVKTAVATGKSYSFLRLIFEFPYQFLRYYFLKKMFAFFGLLCYNDMYAKNLRFFLRSRRENAVLKKHKKERKYEKENSQFAPRRSNAYAYSC